MDNKTTDRETWVGDRPSVIKDKKKDKKRARKESKQLCRNVMKGEH